MDMVLQNLRSDESFAEDFAPMDAVMQEGEAARSRIMAEIRNLGLIERAWELDADGYTVLTPDEVGSRDFSERLLDASLSLMESKFGERPDIAGGEARPDLKSPFGNVLPETGILGEGQVFEEALMNRPTLALIEYLLGESCALIHQTLFLKSAGPDNLPLHTDQGVSCGPGPFPHIAQVANATWALTDYTMANGPICFVPGSHKYCRPPSDAEAKDLSLFRPIEVEAGSMIIWHGNTWHGALRRTAPGVRVSIVQYFGRHFLVGSSSHLVTQEMLDRNSPRFARLLRPKGNYAGLSETKAQAARATLYG